MDLFPLTQPQQDLVDQINKIVERVGGMTHEEKGQVVHLMKALIIGSNPPLDEPISWFYGAGKGHLHFPYSTLRGCMLSTGEGHGLQPMLLDE